MELKHFVIKIGDSHSTLWNLNLDVTTIVMTLVACVITALICLAGVRKINVRKPSGYQNFLEMLTGFIRGIARDAMGDKADTYVPLALTVFIWIFISNQMGVLANFIVNRPDGPHAYWFSPTATISVSLGMGVFIVLLSHAVGLTHPREYFKHWVTPFWILPIHLFEELPKFLTLGLRLWGNIFAGEVLINLLSSLPNSLGIGTGVLAGIIPFLAWSAYSLFVGTIQAFIFTVLTIIYIGQKIPQGESH
ncbi:MAG: atpB [Bacilli bacterium]|nr:atpB [Bacilli bacterium]